MSRTAIPLVLAALILSCGTNSTSTTIDATGGTVTRINGPSLQIPAGALGLATNITIDSGGGPTPPGAVTSVYKFGPEGTAFAKPVTVSFPVPGGTAGAVIYWTKLGSSTDYDPLTTTISGTSATAQVTHFSAGVVVAGRDVTGAFTHVYQPDTGNSSSLPSVQAAGETISAVVAMKSASTGFMSFPGNLGTTTGALDIPGVPTTGHYYFVITPPSPPSTLIEMSTATPDLSQLFSSRLDLVHASGATRLALTVSNLDAWATGDDFRAVSSQASLSGLSLLSAAQPVMAATTFNTTINWTNQGLPDAMTKNDVVYFLQSVPGTAGTGPLTLATHNVTKCFTHSTLTMTNGTTTNATVPLAAAPQTGSMGADMRYTQFDSLAASVNPNAKRSLFSAAVRLRPHSVVFPDRPSGAAADAFGFSVDLSSLASAPVDTNYGKQPYGQCLDLLWKEYRVVDYGWTVPIAGTTITTFPVLYQALEPMSPAPPDAITPLLGPVKSPQVNGKDAFAIQSGVTTQPTLSWSAPAVGTATSYWVYVFDASNANTELFDAHVYSTSFTLPAGYLIAGKTYFAEIDAWGAATDVLDAPPLRDRTPIYIAPAVTASFMP